MTSSFTATARDFDYYGNVEGGADAVKFSRDQINYASRVVSECSEDIDRIWFEMFERVQQETNLGDDETYLLIQKVRGHWGRGNVGVNRS